MKSTIDRTKDQSSQALANTTNSNNKAENLPVMDRSKEAVAQQRMKDLVDKSAENQDLLDWQQNIENSEASDKALKRENKTGVPDQLLAKIEELSGMDLSDVRVYYNSDKPQQIGALAYADGHKIYIAPGEEAHLEEELWHVVQQKQGRVKATMEVNGAKISDKESLEREAKEKKPKLKRKDSEGLEVIKSKEGVIQRAVPDTKQDKTNVCWAASGYAVYRDRGGQAYTDLNAFVTAKGSATAKKNYKDNKVTDIDEIIGSNSNSNNLLSGSDDAGTYGKSGLTAKFNRGEPIVANVNGNHYIVLISRRIDQGTYYVTYMDPADGKQHEKAAEEDATSSSKITKVGNYALSVLYYV